jgi:hypothetical protein
MPRDTEVCVRISCLVSVPPPHPPKTNGLWSPYCYISSCSVSFGLYLGSSLLPSSDNTPSHFADSCANSGPTSADADGLRTDAVQVDLQQMFEVHLPVRAAVFGLLHLSGSFFTASLSLPVHALKWLDSLLRTALVNPKLKSS